MNIASILSNTYYRIGLLVCTMLCAYAIFYGTCDNRPALDPVPQLKPMTPEKYNAGGQYADTLHAGMYITNFAVSDFGQGLFRVDAFVWFRFNPLVFSLDSINQFTFEKGQIIQKEFIESIKIEKDLFVQYRVHFEIKSNMNFKYFPLDNHRVYSVLKNDLFSPNEVILTTFFTTLWFGDNALSLNWSYGEPESDFGYIEAELDRQNKQTSSVSATVIYFDFKRASLREAALIILPFISLLFIILGSLLMALTSLQAIIVAVLVLIAMIMYRMIINHMAPQTSYFMLSDCIFFLVLGCVVLVIITEIANALYQTEDQERGATLRGGVCTLVSIVFLVGWFYLLYVW